MKNSRSVYTLQASKSLRDRQSEIKDFGLPPPGEFYRREIPFPGEKILTLQILRPGISKKS